MTKSPALLRERELPLANEGLETHTASIKSLSGHSIKGGHGMGCSITQGGRVIISGVEGS